MARIRSVHPGLFTDEAFVSLSDAAQVFLIGLWTEADDQGIFEWKPITLRMRLRPTKDGPVEPLLSELEAANCIRRYEMNGRQYGAIRNFRKYQRPKSPNAIHPIADDIRTYVSLSPPISEIDDDEPPSIPPKGEIAPQMEDGGGEKEEGKNKRARARDECEPDFEDWYAAYPRHEGRGSALRAYRTARKKIDAAGLLDAAKRAREKYAGTEPRFVPLPATWLSAERWLDETAKPGAASFDETCPPEIYRGLQ